MAKKRYIELDVTDYRLVLSAIYNKGMAFTKKERDDFHLHGLIPPHIASLDSQKERSYLAFQNKTSDLEKYIYLRDLQDSNETLFYALLSDHIEEMLPIVYTPVVGLGCQKFSHIYRRPRGVFIPYPMRFQIDKILDNKRFDAVKVIVVSDGERILGLGDQGAGGMGIPIGKLTLYTALAGVHPRSTLPILLDTGTDNPDLLNDPLYIGWKHKRIRGKKYRDFIELFVKAIKKRFPHVLLQWEDFAKENASRILSEYQDKLCTFNDDIQGTAGVVLAALIAAINTSKIPLKDHRIVVAGAGSAGCGISSLIVEHMVESKIDEKEALSKFYLVDKTGLLTDSFQNPFSFQKPFIKTQKELEKWKAKDLKAPTLKEVIKNVKPTILIGVTGQKDMFTEEIVKLMASASERPIIFPLSNPTACSESTPQDLMKWTQGKALVATGSPFEPIKKKNKSFRVDQSNNAYLFPGLGLGVVSVAAKRVTRAMLLKAVYALASLSPAKKNKEANLLPPLNQIIKISEKIAFAVAKEAVQSKLAPKLTDAQIKKRIRETMWKPVYLPYKKVPPKPNK